jgi:hypothetical protein
MSGQTKGPDRGLFEPTVTGGAEYDPLPWTPDSNFYVAVFGGIVPATAIAFLNARRLHAPDVARRILVVGLVAFTLFLAGAYNLDREVVDAETARRYARLGVRIAGVVVYFVFLSLLKRPWRRYQVVRGDDHARMFGPGLAAVIVGGFVQAAPMLAIMGEL